MYKKFLRSSLQAKASSLVTTLLVVVVLTIIVVAFMQSMSIERITAKSYANKYRAELMANAATEDALDRIQTAIVPKPYSAVYFANAIAGANARFLYLASYTNKSGALVTERIPLFSTVHTNFSLFDDINYEPIQTNSLSQPDWTKAAGALTRTISSSDDIYTDLNRTNHYYPQGPIGLSNLVLPGNWIYQTNSQGEVIGRYAYWVDDETSKIDIRTADTISRGEGTNLGELSLSALTGLGLTAGQVTNLANYKDQTFEGKSPSSTRYDLDGGTGVADQTLWDRIRPFLTQYSLHDLRSPDGVLSINLNEVVTTTNNPTAIQEQVETIAAAITNNSPTFGERYFQATIPNAAAQTTYVKKVAANIRDYIDTDNTATVIMADNTAYTGTDPEFIDYETIISDIPIVGKEMGPYLNEYASVTRVISPTPEVDQNTGDVTITVRFGHYVELYNPTPFPMTYSQLGPNPRVIIAKQIEWLNKKSNSIIRPADVQLSLPADFTIPANGYAVLTTDGPPWNSANQTDYLGSSTNRYTLTKGTGPGTWSLLGTGGQTTPTGAAYEDYVIATEYNSSDRYNIQLAPLDNSYSGCRERLLFVNDDGIIDYSLRIYTVGSFYLGRGLRNPTTRSTFVADGYTSSNNTNPESSSSAPRLVRGDPRANTEITEIEANTSSSWKSGNSPAYGNNIGQLQMTLGSDNYQWSTSTGTSTMYRQGWAEFSPVGNHIIANSPIKSIGELGFIYDPARYNGEWYRTYGRTLRVGQPDDSAYNRNNNSTAALDRNWIGGVGTNSVTSTNYLRNAFVLANVFRADTNTFGKINPNGALRSGDNPLVGVLFKGFSFDTAGTFQASGALAGKAVNTNAFYGALTNELVSGRPFIGIGDLSRLDVFASSATTNSIATSQSMSAFSVSDGDREETFRRIAGLIATQSLSYSIFVVGQSGSFVGNDFRPAATVRKQTVVQLKPEYSDTTFPARPDSWKIVKPWYLDLN